MALRGLQCRWTQVIVGGKAGFGFFTARNPKSNGLLGRHTPREASGAITPKLQSQVLVFG